MIIVCNSCSAQYSVSDAKVRGKLVRITCKHCASAIIVDGRQMSEADAASQKPVAGYALPRRDESVVAAMPQSLIAARAKAPVSARGPAPGSAPAHAPVSAPVHAPVSARVQAAMSEAMREEDQTMIARSRFGDDMSVHDERTVIGQIPKEALEFERMFAQRTQPPPRDEAPKAPTSASPPAADLPKAPPVPALSDHDHDHDHDREGSAASDGSTDEGSTASIASTTSEVSSNSDRAMAEDSTATDSPDSEAAKIQRQDISLSEPPTMGNKPTSDVQGLVSLAESTHTSVARSASASRLRVTMITLVVLAVLVALFFIQKPR